MKKIRPIILLFLTVCMCMYGQDNRLIYSKSKLNKLQSKSILRNSSVSKSAEIVQIQLDKLKDLDEFSLQFDDKNYLIEKEKTTFRGINDFSFIAKNKIGDGNVVLTILGNDIQGIITKGNELYGISTTKNGNHILTKIDQSKYPEEKCDNFLSKSTNNINKSLKAVSFNNKIVNNIRHNIINNKTSFNSSTEVDKCKIRVLVLYTPSAYNSASNIYNTIRLAVDLTNQSFVNSDINEQIELVYVEKTYYTEVDIETDLNRFAKQGDGYMDEVHHLRDVYAADVCILINNDAKYCGMAKEIKALDLDSFCVVSYECATYKYSFGHEIGHLLGCRHDTYMDNSSSPFSFGHGFINMNHRWRTIMSYNNKCNANGFYCTRIPYWSNPYKTYMGNPTGSRLVEYNARVWNQEARTIMAFRQPKLNVVLRDNDIYNSWYADVVAVDNVETTGDLTVPYGTVLNIKSGNSITLKPGFKSSLGSFSSLKIRPVSDCVNMPMLRRKEVKQVSISNNQIKKNILYYVYPNPSFGTLNIKYTLDTKSKISIKLFDFLGTEIKNIITEKEQKQGTYSLKTDVSNVLKGVYFIRFSINDRVFTEKIIVK